MKPMGTITKYYPFIDEETKSILTALMNESSIYYDFVLRLCDLVLQNEVPVNLAYIAAVQAWWCRLELGLDSGADLMNQIQEKFKDVPQIQPWCHIHTSYESDQIRSHDTIVETIEDLMENPPEDWILTELHLLHAHFHWPMFGDIPSLLEPVEKAKDLINAEPLLQCFEPLTRAYEGWAKRVEGDIEGALIDYRRGLELAEIYDESLHKYMNLGFEADAMKTTSVMDAIAKFEESYVLVQELGVPYLEAEVLHDTALVFETAGEYDLALSSFREAEKVLGLEGLVSQNASQISRVYVILGDGQKALDEINRYIKAFDFMTASTFLGKATALALLDRMDEAEKNLIEAHSLARKSGIDRVLGRYFLAAGFVELHKGDYLSATDIYEDAWELFERVGEIHGEKNLALIGLATAEIQLSKQTTDIKKTVTPGRWLCKLEESAAERDLPGIRMQAALLKSEFYELHGQLKDAQAVLVDALDITESRGVATIRKRISDRINEIGSLMHDEGLVP